MWEHTEKTTVRNILTRYLDNDGADLAMRYFDVIKSFESAAAGKLQLIFIAKAYNDLLTGFRGNSTFERHASSLSPMMVHGFTSWLAFLSDAHNFNENSANDADKATFATSRNQFKDVAIMIYSLTVRDADVNRMRKELLACKEL
jgi:hypothetical protein